MASSTPPRGIMYIRRSSEKQTASLEQQLSSLVGLAKQRGVVVDAPSFAEISKAKSGNQLGDVFWDERSGASQRRPGWNALKRTLSRDSAYTYLFVWDTDRLSRGLLAAASAAEITEIRTKGVTVVSHKGELPALASKVDSLRDTSDIAAFVKQKFDSAFRLDLAQKAIRGLSGCVKQGYWVGGVPPYGFVRHEYHEPTNAVGAVLPKGKRVTGSDYRVIVLPGTEAIDKEKLDVVRRVHREYATGAYGLASIAHRLNEDGIQSPGAGNKRKGKLVSNRWEASAVRSILTNPLYMGSLAWGRTAQGSVLRLDTTSPTFARDTRDDERHVSDDAVGLKRVLRDPKEWAFRTDPKVPFQPIVPPTLWWSNFERLAERGELSGLGSKKGDTSGKYPLRVVCGDCGCPMIGTQRGADPMYVCATYFKQKSGRGQRPCFHNTVPSEVLHAFVFGALRGKFGSPKARKRLRDEIKALLLQKQASAPDRVEAAADRRQHIDELQSQLESVIHQLHGPDAVQSEEARRALNARLRQVDDALVRAKAVLVEGHPERAKAPKGTERQVEETLALFNDLDVFVKRVSKRHVASLFTAIGAEVLVQFDHVRQTGRTISRPRGGMLRLGQGAGFTLPVPGDTESDDAREPKDQARSSRSRRKQKAAPTSRDHKLGKDGRGDWI